VAYHIMGQELPMHDPKYFPGLAPGYHLDDAPGRHMHNNGWAITAPDFWLEGIGIEDPDPKSYIGQGKNFMILSAQSHFINALGACIMGWFSNHPRFMNEFFTAVTGWECDKDGALQAGERIANIRHAFNLREGHNPRAWPYPGMMIGDPPIQKGPLKNVSIDLDRLEDEWLAAYHWDAVTTIPDRSHLEELGIPELWDEIGLP
jgi:aldehyde:ferredoxin oxidoreductase